ncbi:MAG: hypothetical protein ACXADS_11790, partial [Candidatus Thorarchaeota archaeon]
GEGILHQVRDELEITGRYEVARRHFAMEVFDGVLPILGIMMAGLIVIGTEDPVVVFETTLLVSIGTAIAHFMAGFSASYLTETAEGPGIVESFDRGERRRMSHAISLSHKIMVTAERDTTVLVALVNGVTPAGSVLITISPMVLSLAGVIDYVTSFYASITVGCILLLLLGVFLGRLSKRNTIRFVVKTLAAGGLTMILTTIVSLFTGGS